MFAYAIPKVGFSVSAELIHELKMQVRKEIGMQLGINPPH
jgi:hypothetical protein